MKSVATLIKMGRQPCGVCICITKWIPVIFILGVVGWSYYAYVVELCTFTVQNDVERILYLIFYHIFLALFVWSYYQTIMTPICRPPKQFHMSDADQAQFDGITDTRRQAEILRRHVTDHRLPVHTRSMAAAVRYCEKCRLVKPDRCHHCSVCGECVLKMDHHCPWVNNCIGFSNYKYFVLFLGYSFTYCVYVAMTSLQYFISFWQDRQEGLARFHILFLFFVATMFGISLISLFSYHCYLVIKNQTTLETFRPAVFVTGPDKRGFHVGRYNNFCQVFGRRKLKWFLPLATSEGDGVAFPVSNEPPTAVSYGATTSAPATGVNNVGVSAPRPASRGSGRALLPPGEAGDAAVAAGETADAVLPDAMENRSDTRLIVD